MSEKEASDKVVDFEAGKLEHLHKRKEAKVESLRQAFRLARGDDSPAQSRKNRKKRGKTSRK